MGRWITRALSILCILFAFAAFSVWTFAIFTESREWGMFGFVLAFSAAIFGGGWGARAESKGVGAWD